VIVGSSDLGPLAGTGARAVALTNTEQFLRQAKLAQPMQVAQGNRALAHLLKVEADVLQAASGLQGSHAFRTEFPPGPFGQAVRTAAQVVASNAGVAAVRLSLNGFDSHQNQPVLHANLLRQLAEGLAALRSALVELERWNSTLVLTYAEFGRRAQENGSNGTDHGTANVHFALGPGKAASRRGPVSTGSTTAISSTRSSSAACTPPRSSGGGASLRAGRSADASRCWIS
jgi:uncharacterized protein (DUF1501 family)